MLETSVQSLLGRSPAEGNGYRHQYSGLENSMDRGPWQATVHGVAKSRTQLSNFHFHLALKQLLLQDVFCILLSFMIFERDEISFWKDGTGRKWDPEFSFFLASEKEQWELVGVGQGGRCGGKKRAGVKFLEGVEPTLALVPSHLTAGPGASRTWNRQDPHGLQLLTFVLANYNKNKF